MRPSLLGQHNESRSLLYKRTVQSTLRQNFSLSGNQSSFYGKQNVHLRVLFVRTQVANQQEKCKYQFIMIYPGMCEIYRGCLLSLNPKILYADKDKRESNTKSDIMSF